MLRGLALLLDNLLAGLLRLVNAKDSLGAPRARLEVDHLGLPRVDQGLIALHGHVLQIGKVGERSVRLPQHGRVPLHAGQHVLAHVREVARQVWARCIQQARRAKRAEGASDYRYRAPQSNRAHTNARFAATKRRSLQSGRGDSWLHIFTASPRSVRRAPAQRRTLSATLSR
jgi:hypothetical protein